MLDLNLILSLSQACAPQAAPETLAAIAYAESRFDLLAIATGFEGLRIGDRADQGAGQQRRSAAG